MKSFAYVGRDGAGALVRGIKTAETRAEALRELREEGVQYTLLESALSQRFSFQAVSVAIQQILSESGVAQARQGFFRLAASYAKRGSRVENAIAAYLPDCPSPRFKAVLRDVLTALTQDGSVLSDAMEKHKEFPIQHVEMVRACEAAEQSMAPTFERIKEMETTVRRRKSQEVVGRASIYMSYILSLISVGYVSYFYLPRLNDLAEKYKVQDALPPAVRFVSAIGGLLINPLGVLVVISTIVGAVTIWKSLMRRRGFRRLIEQFRWRIGALKELQLQDDRGLALTMLSSMRHAGVDGAKALRLASIAVSSVQFGEALNRQADAIVAGDVNFPQSFALQPLWGPEVRGLLAPADTDFVTLAEDLAGDFEKDSERNAVLAGVAKNGVHLLIAVVLAVGISLVIYLSGFAVNHAILQRNA